MALVALLLSDPVPAVRAAAATVLGNLGDAGMVPHLCQLLERESEFGPGNAGEGGRRPPRLGRSRPPEAVPALAQLLVSGGLLAAILAHCPPCRGGSGPRTDRDE